MTSHGLARYLLELEDRPIVTIDEDGYYHEVFSIIPTAVSVTGDGTFTDAKTRDQRDHAFTAFLIS
jgi:hypothetical protein